MEFVGRLTGHSLVIMPRNIIKLGKLAKFHVIFLAMKFIHV